MARRSKKTAKSSMVEKITIERSTDRKNMMSMIVGTTLISLGVLMLVVGVVLVFLYRTPPKIDKSLPVATVEKLPGATNDKSVTIKGEAKDAKRVMIFVNDQIVEDNLKVENGKFTYEYEMEDEGEYKIQAAVIEGFPVRLRGDKSTLMVVVADWTAPSSDTKLIYTREITASAFTLRGTIDPDTTIVVSTGDKKYVAKSNGEGEFRLRDIPVVEGENRFDVELRDAAGNRTKLDKDVVVAMVADGLNGNGVHELPESAGSLSDALTQLTGNRLMIAFGVLALTILAVNSALVVSKLRNEKLA
jgi:hypothetical protein